jgi:hypothetical protein
MKKTLALFFLLAAAGLLLAGSAKKEIIVAARETRTQAINAFNADLTIRGKVDESIFLLGGKLRLEGEVTGDVICIATQVEIGAQAKIGHDLIVIGGRLQKAENSIVSGEFYNIRSQQDLKKITSSLLPFFPESGTRTFFKIIKIFFWLILSLLLLAIFPVPLGHAAALLHEGPLRHLLHGLFTLLVFLLLLLGFLLLSFVLIGIPLLFLLLAAYFLLLIFGRATVFYFIGDQLSRYVKWKANPARFVVLGVAVYTVFTFIPFLGPLLLIIMDLFAIGIGVDFFLRRRKSLA